MGTDRSGRNEPEKCPRNLSRRRCLHRSHFPCQIRAVASLSQMWPRIQMVQDQIRAPVCQQLLWWNITTPDLQYDLSQNQHSPHGVVSYHLTFREQQGWPFNQLHLAAFWHCVQGCISDRRSLADAPGSHRRCADRWR